MFCHTALFLTLNLKYSHRLVLKIPGRQDLVGSVGGTQLSEDTCTGPNQNNNDHFFNADMVGKHGWISTSPEPLFSFPQTPLMMDRPSPPSL